MSVILFLWVFYRRQWANWVVGDSYHGDHVYLVHRGPLLYYDMPSTYASLYSEGGGLGHHSPETVGGIARRENEHVLVFILNPKWLHFPFHRCLLRSEGSGRKTWGVISHSFLRGVFIEKAHPNSLSLSTSFLTLIVMCGCICGNLKKWVPQLVHLYRDLVTWCARG